MDPSPEDIAAGQKACRAIAAYDQFKKSGQSKISVCCNVFAGLCIFGQIIAGTLAGQYWESAIGIVVIVSVLWGLRTLKLKRLESVETLKQLKAKYGPEIYDALQKEPDTLEYKLLFKKYPSRRYDPPSIELP